MQEAINFSDSGPPEFDKDSWIGKGRKFLQKVANVPLCLMYYIDSLQEQ